MRSEDVCLSVCRAVGNSSSELNIATEYIKTMARVEHQTDGARVQVGHRKCYCCICDLFAQ